MPIDTAKYHEAEVIERDDFSDDLWSLTLRLDGTFPFTPGQYATLGVEQNGKLVQRPYSIASAPHEEQLELFFELVPDGALTPLLHKLRVGDGLRVRKGAKGKFLMERSPGRPKHLMVATVTGLAPFCSMVRELRHNNEPCPHGFRVVILNAASRSWEFGFREEMESYATKLDWLEYIPTVSRPWEDAEWKGMTGRCEDLLRKYSDEFEMFPDDTTVYLCGHPGMIENAKGIMKRRGFAPESLREEQYWVQK